jgi:hypothetical protein
MKMKVSDKVMIGGFLMIVLSFALMMTSYMIILALWYPTAQVDGWNEIEGLLEYQAVVAIGWIGLALGLGSVPTVIAGGIVGHFIDRND